MKDFTVIDIETTGLDPFAHEIIEIGAVRADGEGLSLKVVPLKLHLAEAEALAVNGYSEEEWRGAYLLPDALKKLHSFVVDTHFMAYNATFDWTFLKKAYHDYGIFEPFRHHRYDILSMVVMAYPDLPSYSLKNVCAHLNIPPEPQVHRALNGARCAWEVLQKLEQRS